VKPAQLSKLKEFIGIVDQLRKMIEAVRNEMLCKFLF